VAEGERDAHTPSLTPGERPDQYQRDSAIGPELKLMIVAESVPVEAKDSIDPYSGCINALAARLR